MRKGFRGAGRLLAAADGPRIAVLCVDGWDTHIEQGGTQGQHASLLAELDAAILDFRQCVGTGWQNTLMVCATEFGRTIRINGGKGTDHGVGTATLLAGGAVNGGKIFGDWPGLAPSQLYEGSDLRPTIDLRSVFKGVLRGSPRRPHDLAQHDHLPGECGHVAIVQSDQERHGSDLGESPGPGSNKKRYADRALPGKAGIARRHDFRA